MLLQAVILPLDINNTGKWRTVRLGQMHTQLLDKTEASDGDCLFDVHRLTFLIILLQIIL